jgi:hypothetical protein
MASLEMLVNITMSSTPCLLVYAFGEGEGGEGAARNERQRKAIPPARHHASLVLGGGVHDLPAHRFRAQDDEAQAGQSKRRARQSRGEKDERRR